ncbi:MAG TPA: asparagine synthase-related protein, partial [Candidatus Eisenbacteria bacterium]|nr:asparagine synthase-related protein [Candidatus Eisenbacteria bacterium]
MNQYLERVVDLTEPTANQIYNMTVDEARELLLHGPPEKVHDIEGSFALVARAGKTVKLARSLDRPMRYFLAKRSEGPALVVAHRIDAIRDWLAKEGFGGQFHPNYTRMVPAHYVVELQLIGCPDPDPTYTRFFTPQRNALTTDLDEIGRRYISALAEEIAKWLRAIDSGAGFQPVKSGAGFQPVQFNNKKIQLGLEAQRGRQDACPTTLGQPIGVCFSGGIDSGAVFLTTYHVMKKLGLDLGRLKAFTLTFGDGPDLEQARRFLDSLGLGLFLEPIEADLASLDVGETIRVIEDYKLLDVECATMGLALCRGIRARYPDWRYLIDGDGGDENLKDYPIEENPELTIRSVVNNRMLYQEGWGVGTI